MIVFDASTIILLAKLELLETFISDFHGRLLIPEVVKEEVCTEGSEERPLIGKLIADKKIRVLTARDRGVAKKLMEDFSIDAGEADALTLALQEKARIIATDDRNAIRACKLLKIEFTTAVAVLIRTFEKGLVDKEEALLKLQKLEFVARYGRTIIEDAQQRIKGGV